MIKNQLILLLIFSSQILSYAQGDVVWKFETKNRIYSTPLIDGNLVYFGSGDHSFYALNKKNGKKIWVYKTKGVVHSSPSIQDNIVYFGSGDGNLYGIDKSDGSLVWKFISEGEKMYDLWDYYLSSPVVDDGKVYWGSGDGHLYAIDANSGELIWKFNTGDIVHASPVIYDNKVYFGGFDGNLYCLNKENSEIVWKFKTVGATYFPKGEIQKAALVKDDVVYFGSRDYNIYALNAKTGKGNWNLRQERGWIIATPIEYKGNIYFGTSDAHIFYSMNKIAGTINWTIPVNMRVYGTALAYKDIIYFGTFDGKVIGIDYSTGKTKWEFQSESSRLNYSKIYNEKGEFKDGFELYGSDYQTSEALIHTLGSILSSPVIDEEIIYFGSSDGQMYAVKLK
ncbi:MAG: PQQ-binding-like beta-propeller repeat protein [Bacteroidales bacterium]|nr:PQQ-binding-like beta-propeller repeat protein [Bacteroidales bacterium]